MKKLIIAGLAALVSACAAAPEKTYPYGMTEKEWNELSIQDKAAIRRDFYFVEKGNMNFVNPDLKVEGKKRSHAGIPELIVQTGCRQLKKFPSGNFFYPQRNRLLQGVY